MRIHDEKGRIKPLEPTESDRQAVRAMAECGIRTQDIARCTMGKIDPKTLRKHFRQELAEGRMKANMLVARTLYEKATVDKDVTALIWWTKARMGWRAAWDGPKDRHPECDRGQAAVERIERVVVPASNL